MGRERDSRLNRNINDERDASSCALLPAQAGRPAGCLDGIKNVMLEKWIVSCDTLSRMIGIQATGRGSVKYLLGYNNVMFSMSRFSIVVIAT